MLETLFHVCLNGTSVGFEAATLPAPGVPHFRLFILKLRRKLFLHPGPDYTFTGPRPVSRQKSSPPRESQPLEVLSTLPVASRPHPGSKHASVLVRCDPGGKQFPWSLGHPRFLAE